MTHDAAHLTIMSLLLGDVQCQHGFIFNVYYVLILSANLLSVSHLTNTKKTIELWSDRFIVKDPRLRGNLVSLGVLDSKDKIYNSCYPPMIFSRMTGMNALVTQTDDLSRI